MMRKTTTEGSWLRLALCITGIVLAVAGCSKSESSSTTAASGEEAAGGELETPVAQDIVATAIAAGQFETLVQAVQAAGLVETLQGPGPFTVFAPTDEAFAALPEGTVEELLKPENKEKLQAILTYHVVAGAVTSDQVVTMSSATTVQGSDLSIRTEGPAVMVDQAQVVKADIACSNGVIHVIDKVLMPEDE